MSRKDGTYKLAYEWAKQNGSRAFTEFLVKNKSILKTGKADALLDFYMEGGLGARNGNLCLDNFIEQHEISNSYTGYEEIREAFYKGISYFEGTVYLKKNEAKREDFTLYGRVTALVINNFTMSSNIIIKTHDGGQAIISKKNTKAKLFVTKTKELGLPYNVEGWGNKYLKYLISGTALDPNIPRIARNIGEREGRVERLTPLNLFLSSRKMNLYPSKGQLSRINKHKLKVFGNNDEDEAYERPIYGGVGRLEDVLEERF